MLTQEEVRTLSRANRDAGFIEIPATCPAHLVDRICQYRKAVLSGKRNTAERYSETQGTCCEDANYWQTKPRTWQSRLVCLLVQSNAHRILTQLSASTCALVMRQNCAPMPRP